LSLNSHEGEGERKKAIIMRKREIKMGTAGRKMEERSKGNSRSRRFKFEEWW